MLVGEIVLAGFYSEPLAFAFAPAFMREARIRVAAEWKPADMKAVCQLCETGVLALDGLITHHAQADEAERMAIAQHVIHNDDKRLVIPQVLGVHAELLNPLNS